MTILLLAFLLQGEAVVESVEGDVEFRRPDKSKKWAALVKGAKLATGDQIQTGLKSKCLLKVGDSTRALIRASSFVTLSKAVIEKNKVDSDLRLDVGSVFIEVDEPRQEDVEFKVSTATGTASIRGSAMLVSSSEFGMEVHQAHGLVSAARRMGPESFLSDLARHRHFASMTAGDLSILVGMLAHADRLDGPPTLQQMAVAVLLDQAFRSSQEFTQVGQGVGGNVHFFPRSNGTDNTIYRGTPFIRWGLSFDIINGFTVVPLTRLVTVGGGNGVSIGEIRGQQIFILRDVGVSAPLWRLTNQLNGRTFDWNIIQKAWIPN